MKRIVSILLVSLLVLAACRGGSQSGGASSSGGDSGSSSSSTSSSSSSSETQSSGGDSAEQADGPIWSEPDVMPIVQEPVTYNIMGVYFPHVVPHEDNEMWKVYEEKTNVKINWESVAYNDQWERLALSLTSGDYPDAYFNFHISIAQLLIYGGQGILIPLQDMIAEQGPNITSTYNRFPHIKANSTAPDGNIYSLYQFDPAYHMATSQKMFINQQWLIDSGLGMPSTIEEFADVLRYFRDNDMNGNGNAGDEIPLAGHIGTDPSIFLINPFILNVNKGLLVVNDKVTPIFNTDEYRNAMRYVHSLYAEDLIGTETYTMDGNAFQGLINRPDEMIIGAVGTSMYQGFWMNIELFDDGLGCDTYTSVPPLVGPLGKGQTPLTYDGVSIERSIQITNVCKDPVILIKWIDWFYDEDNAFWQMNGYEDIDWEWVDEESINGERPAYKFIQSLDHGSAGAGDNRRLHNQGPMFFPNEKRYREAKVPGSGGLALYTDSVKYLEYQDPNQKYLPFTVWMDEETARVSSQLQTNIDNYVNESRARFVVGELDVESGWDAYVSEFAALDLDAYVAIWQNVYDVANR